MSELAADLQAVAEGFVTREDYQRHGQKHLYMISQIHASQRSTTTGLSSQQQCPSTPNRPSDREPSGSLSKDHMRSGAAHPQAHRVPKHRSRLARISQAECEWTTTTSDAIVNDDIVDVDVTAMRRSGALEGTPLRVRELLEASGSNWQPPMRPEDLGDKTELDFYEGGSSMLPDACTFFSSALGTSVDFEQPCVIECPHSPDQAHPTPSAAYGATAELQCKLAGDSGGHALHQVQDNQDADGFGLDFGTYQDLGDVASPNRVRCAQHSRAAKTRSAVQPQPKRQAVLVEQSLQALEGMIF